MTPPIHPVDTTAYRAFSEYEALYNENVRLNAELTDRIKEFEGTLSRILGLFTVHSDNGRHHHMPHVTVSAKWTATQDDLNRISNKASANSRMLVRHLVLSEANRVLA